MKNKKLSRSQLTRLMNLKILTDKAKKVAVAIEHAAYVIRHDKINSFKKSTIVMLSLVSVLHISAQEVVSTQGDSYSNEAGSIDFTIGELIINTATDGTNVITQGFHQTSWTLVGIEDFASVYEAFIFPNPAQDILSIKTSSFEHVKYSLYNMQGKLIMQKNLSALETSIEVEHLASGSYVLVLNNEKQVLKKFKLIKQN